MLLERSFLSSDGLSNRNWYKHTITAPGRYTGYSYEMFPGIIDSIRENNIPDVLNSINQVTISFNSATSILKVDLSN